MRYRVKGESGESAWKETLLNDISGGGMGLHLKHSLKKGQSIEAFIYFSQTPEPVRVNAKVMWCKKMDSAEKEETYAIGLQYEDFNREEKEKFILLFCETMVNYFTLSDSEMGPDGTGPEENQDA